VGQFSQRKLGHVSKRIYNRLQVSAEAPVFHVKAAHRTMTAAGAAGPRTLREIWIDTETGNARLSETDEGWGLVLLQVRNGITFQEYWPSTNHLSTRRFVGDDPYLGRIQNQVWLYRDALAIRTVAQKGEAEVDGRRVIQAEVLGPDSELPKIQVLLDKETLLPVRRTYFRTEADGSLVPAETVETTYPTVEYVSRDTLPPGFLEISVSPGASVERYDEMTVDEARGFANFDLYYVGEAFENFQLRSIYDFESMARDTPPVRFVHFIYEDRSSAPESPAYLFVESMPAAGRPPRVVAPGRSEEEIRELEKALDRLTADPGKEEIMLGGVVATLSGGAATARIELNLGDAIVKLSGQDRAQVVRAAEALVRLNTARP